jgi:hypothetical protein
MKIELKTAALLYATGICLLWSAGCEPIGDANAQPADPPAIRLAARTFEARPGVEAGVEARFVARNAETLHLIVQFVGPLSAADRARFETGSRIQLRDPVPDNAYVAVVPLSAVRDATLFDENRWPTPLRAIVDLRATDKIAPSLLANQIPEHASLPGGRVAVIVQFHGDVDAAGQADALTGLDVRRTGAVPLARRLEITIPVTQLTDLADHDAVKWIEEVPPPPEDANDAVRSVKGVNSDAVNAVSAYGLTGADVVIAQWEEYIPDKMHDDFGGRIVTLDPLPSSPSLMEHATHVAGTAIGSGVKSSGASNGGAPNGGGPNQWQGVAPGAKLRSYNADVSHVGEYSDATSNGATISTNSWGSSACSRVVPPNVCYPADSISYDAAISGRWTDGTALGLARRVVIVGAAGNVGAPERHVENTPANGKYDVGEGIYLDRDDDGAVSSGTPACIASPSPPPGGCADYFLAGTGVPIGSKLIDFRPNERHEEGVTLNSGYDPGETVYRDEDGSGTVTENDVRLSAGSAGAAGSTVAAGATDVGTFLRPFALWGNTRAPHIAKNTIVVGAYNVDTELLWAQSSRGPTPDGRLKPDLVAPGAEKSGEGGVKSTYPNNAYGVRGATSMATPVVAGAAALLTQWYRNVCRAGDPKPSTIRALLLHSAIDKADIPNISGVFKGPDYAYGYGAVNVLGAVDLAPHHAEGTIAASGSPDGYTITIGSVRDLKVTLVWDDPPWNPVAAPSPSTGLLQNDLDLEVVAPDGTRYTPWQLNPANPLQHAVASAGYASGATIPSAARDRRNTVEQVVVATASPGTWTIRVIGSSLTLPTQEYSLVSELLPPQSSPCNSAPATDVWLRDNPSDTGATPSTGQMWLSPDVWNRVAADAGTTHQNPVFGLTNSLYVQLRNRSPELAQATSIDVWIAPASTGLSWPDDFEFVGRLTAPKLPAGGNAMIGPLLWNPPAPNPSDHFCFYVRVVNAHDPVTLVEGGDVGINASQSNNLAWRNVNVIDLAAGAANFTLLTENPEDEEASVEIFIEMPEALLAIARPSIALSPSLRQPSVESSGVAAEELRRANGQFVPLRSARVRLTGIRYEPFQKELIRLSFAYTGARTGEYPVDITQRVNGKIVGGVRYLVRTGRSR